MNKNNHYYQLGYKAGFIDGQKKVNDLLVEIAQKSASQEPVYVPDGYELIGIKVEAKSEKELK